MDPRRSADADSTSAGWVLTEHFSRSISGAVADLPPDRVRRAAHWQRGRAQRRNGPSHEGRPWWWWWCQAGWTSNHRRCRGVENALSAPLRATGALSLTRMGFSTQAPPPLVGRRAGSTTALPPSESVVGGATDPSLRSGIPSTLVPPPLIVGGATDPSLRSGIPSTWFPPPLAGSG